MNTQSIFLTSALMVLLFPLPAVSQSLGNGDYALCEVRGRDDRFVGYDSVCLESRRAALRRLQQHGQRGPRGGYRPPPVAYYHGPPIYTCPMWANNGHGYSSTVSFNGRMTTSFGTFDSQVDGNQCIPHPVRILPGVR